MECACQFRLCKHLNLSSFMNHEGVRTLYKTAWNIVPQNSTTTTALLINLHKLMSLQAY